MEPIHFALLGIALFALSVTALATIVTVTRWPRRAAEERKRLRDERGEAEAALSALRAERGRAMSLMATAARRAREASGDDDDDDDGEADGATGLLAHPVVRGMAQRLGVDVDKFEAGDPAETKKVETLLAALAQKYGLKSNDSPAGWSTAEPGPGAPFQQGEHLL